MTGTTYPNADTQSYTYDPMGNRLTKVNNGVTTSYTYDNADQMTAAGGVTFGYDNNGNQTGRGADTFGYNAENRLTSTNLGGVAGSYAYNGDGLRMSRTIGGTGVSYAWGVKGSLPGILQDSQGNKYVYGFGLISRTDNTGAQEYYLPDGLGSTTGLANGTGTVTGSYAYDVFGAIRSQTGTSPNEFTFAGQQVDSNGLDYLRARYYDNATGRFLVRDPLPLVRRYPYVGNNPVNLVDPYGLFPCPGCNVVMQIVTKPVNDARDTVHYIDTLVEHPGSGIQNTLGQAIARLSFGDRFETGGGVFYQNCWGACSVFRFVPNAGNITVGSYVFGQGNINEQTVAHELTHVRQGDRYGPRWLYEYFREELRHGYGCNRFEEEARKAAGEPSRCDPSKE